MEYIAAGAGLIIWLACLYGCVVTIRYGMRTDYDGPFTTALGGVGVVAWIGITAFVIYLIQHPDNRPCVRYETTYMMVGKVMSPVKYCVQYGEVVVESK